MNPPDRYGTRPPRHHPEAWWLARAKEVVLAMLDAEYAVTVAEMEARASDRIWDRDICPDPIAPHWFVNARRELQESGLITSTSAPSRSHPDPITTWHRPKERPLISLIENAAQRKRLLTARHAGWAERGGGGIGLTGKAGERALDTALRDSPTVSGVTGSTLTVLGVDLQAIGEIDNSAIYVDTTNASQLVPIQLMFEVKNRRQHYYRDDQEVLHFLRKAAIAQKARPSQLILPVFVCRRRQWTLWDDSQQVGYLPAQVNNQLILPDNELDQATLQEVIDGLGFRDLRLGDQPTNFHTGIVRDAIPRYARALAELWQDNYVDYL